jgi:hypothetical protein
MALVDQLVVEAAAALADFVAPTGTDAKVVSLVKISDIDTVRACHRQVGDAPDFRHRVVVQALTMMPSETVTEAQLDNALQKMLSG